MKSNAEPPVDTRRKGILQELKPTVLSSEPLAKLYREDDYLAPEGPSTIAQDGP
jgi:hypothetical protein